MITELKDYIVNVAYRFNNIDKEVKKDGIDAVFNKQLHWLDCTRWNAQHTYRLMQTIGYDYRAEMTLTLHILEAFPDDKTKEREKALLDRHYKNIEYENEHPPVIYDKKRGLKDFRKKTQIKSKRVAREPRESSASRKLKEHVAKINMLSFKLKPQ